MTDVLSHRGPDGRGELELTTSSQRQLALGHRRLAIIDLSAEGKQPMSRGSLHVVFNGEIYNYRELKKELLAAGQSFRSSSDTEVILAAVQQWGLVDAVTRMNGMFAIALYDADKDELHLVRDRAGVKPLYYYADDGLFLFASELKSFHAHPRFDRSLSDAAIASYFRYGFVPNQECIYESASKVPPGHLLTIDLRTSDQQLTKYWDLFDSFNRPKLQMDLGEAAEQLDSLLQSAFQYRMVSDVPVGIFLSGGYDSSVVTAMLQRNSDRPLKTFTIGFEYADFDESPHAKAIADQLGTDHTEHFCTSSEAQQIIPTLPDYFDEPFGDASAIPTILVSQLARRCVKVALSADAGDELFGGYNRYAYALDFLRFSDRIPRWLRQAELFGLLAKVPLPQQAFSQTLSGLEYTYRVNPTHCQYMHRISHVFKDQELARLLPGRSLAVHPTADDEEFRLNNANDPCNKMLAVDYKSYLTDDILTKVDRATMSVSLEGREPLLDYRIAEFAAQMPSEFKIRDGERKYILKLLAHRLLPKELLDRPKKGFSVPYFHWLRTDLKHLVDEFLCPTRIAREGILNPAFVQQLTREFLRGNRRTNVRLWNLLVFQMWLQRWGGAAA